MIFYIYVAKFVCNLNFVFFTIFIRFNFCKSRINSRQIVQNPVLFYKSSILLYLDIIKLVRKGAVLLKLNFLLSLINPKIIVHLLFVLILWCAKWFQTPTERRPIKKIWRFVIKWNQFSAKCHLWCNNFYFK